ncbi:MAG: oxidoreductase [Acidimicrobiia bacterium]|nr:MAG: oxidoreductase [Acidimicrobiia bacterium]
MDVTGKRALVTGASSGIGAELAVRLAAAGATVGICARRADRLAEVLERCREHAPGSRMWVCDLADPGQLDALARDVTDAYGGIDVLVNNAGIPKRRHVTALDAATVEAVMRVNYLAPVRLTLALLPGMIEQGAGLVVNVSSVAATLSSPGEAAYDASKAALSVFSEAMAIDLWDTGVRVLVVYPGVVDTELFSVPGNDPLPGDIERITAGELVDGVMDAIARDVVEVYVPGWFKQIAASKAADVGGFLAGSAAWVREQRDG